VYTTAQSSNSQPAAPTITSTPPANPFNSDTPTDLTAVSSIRSEEGDKKAFSSISASNSNMRSSPSSEPKRTSSPRSNGYVIVSSLDGVVRAVSPQPQGQDVHLPSNPGAEQDRVKAGEEKKEKSPTEWTVDDVIDWLKSKGFDQDVQTKFIGKLLCLFTFLRSRLTLHQRTRNHRRRPPRARRQPAQERNRDHGIWKTRPNRQRHRRITEPASWLWLTFLPRARARRPTLPTILT